MAKYKPVVSGRYTVYKKKENPWPWIIGVGIVVLMLIGAADSESAEVKQTFGVKAAYSYSR